MINEDGVKCCSKCGSTMNRFRVDNHLSDGLKSECVSCCRVWEVAYYRNNVEKVKAQKVRYLKNNSEKVRDARHVRVYGITLAERDGLIEDQGGVDPISLVQFSSDNRPNTDHVGGTSVIRGILTNQTNQAIGLLKHDPLQCLRAYLYLTKEDDSLSESRAIVRSLLDIHATEE